MHVKLDTGMGRLGTRDPAEATRVAEAAAAADGVRLAGAMTHFATADERGDAFFGEQLERFAAWVGPLRDAHPQLVVHAANSAAHAARPRARTSTSCAAGVAIYGLDPFGEDPAARELEPALELRSYVARGQARRAGRERRLRAALRRARADARRDVPIGYGDGVRRALTNNADVLVRGARRPLVGHGQHGQRHARRRHAARGAPSATRRC